MSQQLSVTLLPLSADNWYECAGLAVAEIQKAFLPPNVYSIAAAQFYPDSVCRAVHAGQSLVGFAMYGIEQESQRAKLFRLMIDAKYQRLGYGRAALALAIDEMSRIWAPASIYVSYQTENAAARKLY